MDLGLNGKVALVTGGSRGLGRESALALAREGANVAICGRTQSTLDETVNEIKKNGGICIGVVADISDASSVEHLHTAVTEAMGQVDILVNNAG
ncbi:MAG: SDR family NAD(P)-dependent oxidoreductase, partial [Chloroflexota bacterium]|nr:SDR family NAD(P)-dependent oxidoreductase [Chloroflexota bacterium]